jgi:hypothetical protein
MPGKRHLHIGEDDSLGDWVGEALKSVKGGRLEIGISGEPAVKVRAEDGTISVDLLKAGAFKVPGDETGLFDKLKTASEFGRKLSESGVTLSFLRKGKEAVRIGKDAHPTISKAVTRSDDIQLTSLREFARLKGELKAR